MSYPHSFFGIITPVLQFTVSPWWPVVVLSVSVCFIIVAISWWRMHAFVALLLAEDLQEPAYYFVGRTTLHQTHTDNRCERDGDCNIARGIT